MSAAKSRTATSGAAAEPRTANLAELLSDRRACIVAGPGGAGKTTVSAAIAAAMAARGLKVAVLTIDPARRLADALGLGGSGESEQLVDPQRLADAGLGGGAAAGEPGARAQAGELWALMLDSKATFDSVVGRHAPDDAARERVLANRIYQRISTALAGSQEYMAMERLHELDASGSYDLIVLDTPPSQQAVEFLEAPRRLTELIDGRAIRAFVRPTGIASRVAGRSAAAMFSILRRITGVDLLRDLAEFFDALSGMTEGFRDRARSVEALLADPATGFLVVSAPEPEPVADAIELRRRLRRAELPLLGAVVNRVQAEGERLAALDERHLAEQIDAAAVSADDAAGRPGAEAVGSLGERVATTVSELRLLAERDREMTLLLRQAFEPAPVLAVEQLSDEASDLRGLAAIAASLLEQPLDQPRERRA